MVGVPPPEPGLVGHDPGLGEGPSQLVAQPPGLAHHCGLGVGRLDQHLGEQAEQVAQAGAQGLPRHRDAVGAVVDTQPAADPLEGLGELTLATTGGAEQHGAAQQRHPGEVGVAADRVGHAQPQVHEWHGGAAYGDDPEAARQHPLGDRGQPLLAGSAQAGNGLGPALAAAGRGRGGGH
jgi:hypothetical protein